MPSSDFDPGFGSAIEAAATIRARKISSVELTQHVLRRIDAFQPKLNAYVYQLREEALAAARKADEELGRDEATGPLHGVPINVKESFGVQGQPCTWGIPAFKDTKAAQNAVPVRRLLDAGAILLGATNVPLNLMDAQSFNDIYGATNNPWDLSRTPGGSSGGSAASLAAGLAFLSIGSDIGGSIRNPASFCGIYGHKPTLDIVNMSGHLPGGVPTSPGFSTLLAVAGPMARSAEDLETALRILAGPEPPDSKAYQWTLPAPRHNRLADFRIGYVLEDPAVPVSAETKSVLEAAVRACEKAGATVKPGWPEGLQFPELLDTYFFMLGAFDFSMMPPGLQPQAREHMAQRTDSMAKGSLSTFADWQTRNRKRLGFRARFEKFFESVDVFLLPTAFTTAFPHDRRPIDARTVPMPDGGSQPFLNLLTYIAPATLTGCPATAAPAGLSKSGLPVGLQIVGPYLEDATPIRFAQLLAREIGGFQAPPSFGNIA
ncbi:MAG TPA: amidase [Bryobacteraceae bacterium]|nr:amidase [Bryobacteraceae bacterium]